MERAVIKSAGSSPHTRGARHPFRNARRQLRIIPAYAGSTTTLRRPSRISWDHPRIRGEHDCSIYFTNFPTGSSPHTRGAQGDRRHPCAWVGIIPAYAGSTRNKPPIPSWKDGSSPHTRGARPSTEDSTRAWTDHPRIRGEHLGWLSGSGGVVGSSPHTRGARVFAGPAAPGAGIIPAYAGSTPSLSGWPTGSPDHPRIRGEHSCTTTKSSHALGIIPAYAGSTACRRRCCSGTWDHPRIRGEHISPPSTAPALRGSSPHTRGARRLGLGRRQTGRIIPAYAGSTRSGTSNSASTRDHPRIRGEHQRRQRRREAGAGSSPHTRGAHRRQHWDGYRLGIIPAYAGSTSNPVSALLKTADHPRIRGEHNVGVGDLDRLVGSSPHTRGARSSPMFHRSDGRIIPAYAGSTWIIVTRQAPARDHPRIRGEHGGVHMIVVDGPGSSPHTRGALSTFPPLAGEPGIIPAYAGSTLYSHFGSKGIWDHPRIRGEHPGHADRPASTGGSSPHTRGAHTHASLLLRAGGIIPAYAGSTPTSREERGHVPDHPRIRGEHLLDGRGKPRNEGSSPHTRGARRYEPPAGRAGGIIPAYAGSTPRPGAGQSPAADHPRIRGEHPCTRSTATAK